MDKKELVKEAYSNILKIVYPLSWNGLEFNFDQKEINILLKSKDILRDKYLSLVKDKDHEKTDRALLQK